MWNSTSTVLLDTFSVRLDLAPTEQNNILKEHTNFHQQRFDGVIDTALEKAISSSFRRSRTPRDCLLDAVADNWATLDPGDSFFEDDVDGCVRETHHMSQRPTVTSKKKTMSEDKSLWWKSPSQNSRSEDRQTDTTPQKAGHTSRITTTTEKCFALLEIYSAAQCWPGVARIPGSSVKQCNQYGAAGHVCCHCERSLNYIDPDSVFRQHMRFAEQRCEFLTTSAFILKKESPWSRTKANCSSQINKDSEESLQKHQCISIHESWTTEYIFSLFLPLVLMLWETRETVIVLLSCNTHEPVCTLAFEPFYDRLAQAQGLRPMR